MVFFWESQCINILLNCEYAGRTGAHLDTLTARHFTCCRVPSYHPSLDHPRCRPVDLCLQSAVRGIVRDHRIDSSTYMSQVRASECESLRDDANRSERRSGR